MNRCFLNFQRVWNGKIGKDKKVWFTKTLGLGNVNLCVKTFVEIRRKTVMKTVVYAPLKRVVKKL